MSDRFKHHSKGITAPALGAFTVAPSDTADLPDAVRAVTLGTGGTLSFMNDDGLIHTTAPLPAGTYSLLARRVRATGTTATDITGWI